MEPDSENELLEEEPYKPRPARQVWAARIGLAVFLVIVILYYMLMFKGGA